jgi:uncharacterized membrane protein
MSFFARYVAPVILILCGLTLIYAGIRKIRFGYQGRGIMDFIWACVLFVMSWIMAGSS